MAIQGFGNVGRNLARLLADEGARIVALSDSSGGVVNSYGIDVLAAVVHKAEHGVLSGLPGTEDARTRSCSSSSATCSCRARSSRR